MIPVIELLINLLIVNRYPVWICYCNLHDLYYSTTTLTVYCVNDAAVMKGWALDQKSEGTIVSMMGDPACEFTKACGMEMTHPGPPSVGIIGRCKRLGHVRRRRCVQARRRGRRRRWYVP